MSPREICAAIAAAEREGAKLMRQAHDILAESKTDHRDLVTQYDRAVQELLMERLSAALPGARFFCEENDRHDDLQAEHLFIIDPIDGTMNFVRRLNHSAISVAYTRFGRVEAAAVYNPYVDEMFSAVRGEGAFLNGKPIHVDPAPLGETVICFGSAPYNPELTERTFELARRSYLTGLDDPRFGTAAWVYAPVLALLLLGVLCWVFPLLSRFTFGFVDLNRTAARLALGNILRSLAAALLTALGAAACLLYTTPIIFVPGLVVWLWSYLMEPVFARYEKQ